MNILYLAFVFLSLLSLSFGVYFLVRFIIAKMSNQPQADYLKKLIVQAVILAVSLTGLYMVSDSSEQPASKQEKIQAEIPPEEVKEKIIAEEKAAKEARKQAEREASRREKALAKTLRVTPEEFNSRFLAGLQSDNYTFNIITADTLSAPTITDDGKTETHSYMFDDNFGMNEIIDKSTGNIKEVNMVILELSREDIIITLMNYSVAVKAISPDLSVEDLKNIERELGFGADTMKNLLKNVSTVYKGKRYNHRITKDLNLAFSISVP